MAEAGDVPAIKYVFDRMDGKPVETIKAKVDGVIANMDKINKKIEDALLK
jgi:hypothetical protein